jgi:putative ATP-binding cassette transporter
LDGVAFSYEDDEPGHGNFVLGPVDFRLGPGELVFIVGGNGSGKSTFVKLVVGLYRPRQGEIRLGGTPIADANRDWYRQHFSVVFSDFHLFERFLGLDGKALDVRAQMYLRYLALDQKVQVTGQRLSTTALSQGQRRRLALLTAYLEDRPFYVFDEWAADQDPQYKEIFYTELLPELRARGKGVAIITHDDRYFHLGDRIIKLDEGKIIGSWRGSSAEEEPIAGVKGHLDRRA